MITFQHQTFSIIKINLWFAMNKINVHRISTNVCLIKYLLLFKNKKIGIYLLIKYDMLLSLLLVTFWIFLLCKMRNLNLTRKKVILSCHTDYGIHDKRHDTAYLSYYEPYIIHTKLYIKCGDTFNLIY